MHQFPKNEKLRRKWTQFVFRRDPKGWTAGTGHICSDHFAPHPYHNYYEKPLGLATKLSLKDDAVPTIYPCKVPRLISSSTLKEARESAAVVKLNAHKVSLKCL